MFFLLLLILPTYARVQALSSPLSLFSNYTYSTELERNVIDLWWSVDDEQKEITFELHAKTIGWVALGISPAGGMVGADIAVIWVDSLGNVQLQDRYAYNFSKPVLDNSTSNWIKLKGREQNGWTAVQFKRFLDTCDGMDVPIKSGTNILIYAYALNDPVNDDISYHASKRGSRMIPLQSYSMPPLTNNFKHLESLEFRMSNFSVPPKDTTYHCKVFKIPNRFKTKQHAIAHQVIIDPVNFDLVHHMDLYECKTSRTFPDDENLPDGNCDEVMESVKSCSGQIVTVWSVGADLTSEYVSVAGYPFGGEEESKYFVLQIHYDNPSLSSNRRDNSGMRFFVDKQLRKYDLGYISFGTSSSPYGISIPPRADRFVIDSYCTADFSKNFPRDGIQVVANIPHTHLQGRSVWTKLIRQKKAVDYLFDADSFNFNYQFENRLRHPITLHKGDEFATRCIFSTTDKDVITLGGPRTKDEMCLNYFMYYPRINRNSFCRTEIDIPAWQNFLGNETNLNDRNEFKNYLNQLKWTKEHAEKWQLFYQNATQLLIMDGVEENAIQQGLLDGIPFYEDLPIEQCKTP